MDLNLLLSTRLIVRLSAAGTGPTATAAKLSTVRNSRAVFDWRDSLSL